MGDGVEGGMGVCGWMVGVGGACVCMCVCVCVCVGGGGGGMGKDEGVRVGVVCLIMCYFLIFLLGG